MADSHFSCPNWSRTATVTPPSGFRTKDCNLLSVRQLSHKIQGLLLFFFAINASVTTAQQASEKTAANNPNSNAITQAAVKQGILSCASRINSVTNFLGYTPQSGVIIQPPPSQPDQRMVPVSIENQTEVGSAYVSANFAPNQANGCGATYDSVVYWAMSCDALADKQYGNLNKVGNLGKTIKVLDGGLATKIFLMPAGSGCISIKKEVVL